MKGKKLFFKKNKKKIIIKFVKFFYFKYKILPSTKILIELINKKYDSKIDSIYLYKIFNNKNPIKEIAKLIKVPYPKICL